MRLFLAVALGDRARAYLDAQRQRFVRSGLSVRWSRPATWHVTLRFLGETTPAQFAALGPLATDAVAPLAPFEVLLGGCGVFPERGPARVIWVGVQDPAGKLAHLAARLEAAVGRAGFAAEARPFRGHITLARIAEPAAGRRAAELARAAGHATPHAGAVAGPAEPAEPVREDARIAVHEVTLFESTLSRAGAQYRPLRRFALAGAAATEPAC